MRRRLFPPANNGNIITGEGMQVPDKLPIKATNAVNQTSPTKLTEFSGGRVSSNVFANGANQNSGNFITDKPITRIHAPPGGVSTLRLY